MTSFTARRYDSGEPVRIALQNGRITDVEPIWTREPLEDWPWVAPAFFDLQINGYGGVWFADEKLTVEQVLEVLAGYRTHGVGRLFPTLITSSRKALEHGFRTVRAACEKEAWADRMVAGCHLEGPYISDQDGPRGAHPVQHVRPCDWSEFEALNAASGGRIRLVTVAAEAVGAAEFIRRASDAGILVALGHQAADAAQIRAAVDAGARLSTHLGNGAAGMLKRHPNFLWDQLADDRLIPSVISDGHHLPDAVLKTFVAAKSPERVVITCDASGLAGMPPGVYPTAFGPFEVVDDGRIVVAGQRTLLAGSALTTEVCVGHMVKATGVTLGQACDMAGRIPLRLCGLDAPRLIAGAAADLVLFGFEAGAGKLTIDKLMTA
ncbi:N-acetylglucosamine-6-phosphate deacetylase [Caulifigura coniformis]|uniref:N-acetylglucosamine-6-phosphate deacetylase n=1 Tax=Caulifigura coniformis TaxID=2527983 RepID=A0A517SFS5_9PLAN|nr:N-acetylglucosamine-6-phosphate deacetylase [Caulifigura coniformis]QDT54967.1 N-acetylglucosamine-6-phosphate deacetylase [Caulifigura coniformis]